MIVDSAAYVDGHRVSGPGSTPHQLHELVAGDGFAWIGLRDPEAGELEPISSAFDLHPLALEDMMHGGQRSKVEDYGEHEFIVLKTLRYDDPTSQVETGELAIYVTGKLLLTVRRGEAAALSSVRSAAEAAPDWLRIGPYAVVHLMLDRVVDEFLNIVHELEHDVSNIEQQVFSDGSRSWAQELYFLKREVIEFRSAVDPTRLVLDRIATDQNLRVPDSVRHFFRDIQDHVNRAAELAASLDLLLASAMSADIAQVQIRQNEDMRKITAWVAMAAVPTMLAGIWGMNFKFMPELSHAWGYPMALAMMGGSVGVLFRKFKKSGWL